MSSRLPRMTSVMIASTAAHTANGRYTMPGTPLESHSAPPSTAISTALP